MKKLNKNEILQWLVGFIGMIVMIILIVIAAILQGCNSGSASAKQTEDDLPRKIVMLQYEVDNQREIIKAYGNLLHVIWLDKPTYIEECLSESDEFAVLDVMFDSEWGDIFRFRCEEDSLAYIHNWDNEQYVTRIVKHVVSPRPPFGGEEEEK